MTSVSYADSLRPNYQKFALLLAALSGMIVLVITGQATWSDVSAPFGLIVGYGTANGIGAVKGVNPTPLFLPVNPHRRATDGAAAVAVTALDDGTVEVVEVEPADPAAARRAELAAQAQAERDARRRRAAEG